MEKKLSFKINGMDAFHEHPTHNTNAIKIKIRNSNIFLSIYFVTDRSFLVANAQSETFHIIFCSDGFCKMTGFTRAEVMQRASTTEFLHGPMTSQQAVNLIKDALAKGFEKHFEILYYRKNGKILIDNFLYVIMGIMSKVY